jgi:hypothetical protein
MVKGVEVPIGIYPTRPRGHGHLEAAGRIGR